MQQVITKNNLLKRKRFWAGFLLAQFVMFFIFSKIDVIVRFFEWFFEVQKEVHLKLFSWANFSVGDIFYLILFSVFLYLIINIILNKNRKKPVVTILILLNIFYLLYQVFWGMLYFQQPLSEKLSTEEPSLDNAKRLAKIYLAKCKETRKLVNEDQNGVFNIQNIEEIQQEILLNQIKIPHFLSEKKPVQTHSFKPSFFDKIMSYTGILGYYNPFSAEAQFNPNLPSTYLPFTIAHESAHQLGFAREQEANFMGYLIGKDSENLDLRYSTEYFTLKSLLNSIVEKDPEFVKSILENYSEQMLNDRAFEKEFNEKHQGILDAFFGFTNDLFLKSNQQEGSITYSYFVELLIAFEKQ